MTAKKIIKRKSSSFITSNCYEDIYKESIQNPEQFWAKLSELVSWTKPWTKILNNTDESFPKWFVGGEINACYNAVDRHIESGKGSKIAIIFESPQIGVAQTLTYIQLQEKVAKLAGALADLGVTKGDTVLIYMPVLPETIIAMLATVRLGAIHSVVFGGFAALELCTRIEHCKPKVIVAANCGIEPNKIVRWLIVSQYLQRVHLIPKKSHGQELRMQSIIQDVLQRMVIPEMADSTYRYMDNVNEAIALSRHKPSNCVIYQRRNITVSYIEPNRDIDWEEAIQNATPHPCVPIEANDPLYILYTSGTTGEPKGVQRPIGGHLVTLAWSMSTLYGLTPNDVWWCASDFGWVVGHSYMCYAPLLCGMTTILFEGKPTVPDPSVYYRIISDHKVNAVFTVPTVLRLLKREDPEGLNRGDLDLSSLRHMFIAGEHCDHSSKSWGEKIFGVPVLNHWWQTETGHAITAPCTGLKNSSQPPKLTTGLPFPGFNIEILREDGSKAENGALGRIMVKLPLPPGTLSTLYKAESRFVQTYLTKFPGYYDTMDAGYMDEDGWVYVTARDDDVIKIAGHRLSTLAMENIILSHPDISDACVVAVPDKIKNEVPFCFFVMKNDSIQDEDLIRGELFTMVRETIGPVASFRLAAAVRSLPQTRSGKICRKSISDMAKNNDIKIPSTVVDPTIYEDIKDIFIEFGFCK